MPSSAVAAAHQHQLHPRQAPQRVVEQQLADLAAVHTGGVSSGRDRQHAVRQHFPQCTVRCTLAAHDQLQAGRARRRTVHRMTDTAPTTGDEGPSSTVPAAQHAQAADTSDDHISDDGQLQLLVGDCLRRLTALADRSVNVIVTSPPYNIGVPYRSYNDQRPYEEYLSWLEQVFTQLRRVLADDGSLFLNVGATSTNPWLAFDVANRARTTWVLQNHITWAKSLAVGDTTYGHFKPINSKRFVNNVVEDIFHFTKTGQVTLDRHAVGVPFTSKSNIARFGHTTDRRCKGNVWHIPYKTVKRRADKYNHPAIFPEQLVEHCVRLHGLDPTPTLLDPFAGTGTSLVVAKQLHLPAIGIELDPDGAAHAWQRIEATRPSP